MMKLRYLPLLLLPFLSINAKAQNTLSIQQLRDSVTLSTAKVDSLNELAPCLEEQDSLAGKAYGDATAAYKKLADSMGWFRSRREKKALRRFYANTVFPAFKTMTQAITNKVQGPGHLIEATKRQVFFMEQLKQQTAENVQQLEEEVKELKKH